MFLALSILCVTLLTAGALFLFNNLMLRQVNEQRTRDYLVDVSAQVASQIDARIAQSIESLNIIRDSAVLLGPEALPEFITRKESVAGFDELCLADIVEFQPEPVASEEHPCKKEEQQCRKTELVADLADENADENQYGTYEKQVL